MLPEHEALVGIAICAMYADGVLDAAEALELEDRLLEVPALADYDEDDLQAAHEEAVHLMRTMGEERYLQHCAAALPRALHAQALEFAEDMLAADEDDAQEEAAFLARLRKALHMPTK